VCGLFFGRNITTAMNRDEKAAVIDEVAEGLGGASAVFAIDYRGITVSQSAELRGKLREADASFSIVKNRLAKLAAEKAGAEGLSEHFVGPTALTLISGDVALAAKAIAGFTKQYEVLAFKGGLMEGAVIDADQFVALAKLPGVDQLRAQLVGVAASPITGVVRTLNALIAGLASQLGQISDQGLVDNAPAAGPVAEEASAETSEAETETEPEPETETETEPETETETETQEESD
jgi:large subunit ribosomal protein L10